MLLQELLLASSSREWILVYTLFKNYCLLGLNESECWYTLFKKYCWLGLHESEFWYTLSSRISADLVFTRVNFGIHSLQELLLTWSSREWILVHSLQEMLLVWSSWEWMLVHSPQGLLLVWSSQEWILKPLLIIMILLGAYKIVYIWRHYSIFRNGVGCASLVHNKILNSEMLNAFSF